MSTTPAEPKAPANRDPALDPIIKAIVSELETTVKSLVEKNTSTQALEAKFTEAQEKINKRLGEIDAKLKADMTPVSVIGSSEERYKGKTFDIGRACAAILTRDWSIAPLERAIFDEAKKAADRIPGYYQRAQVTNIDAQGGEIVPIEVMTTLIEKLRAASILDKLGTTNLTLNKMLVRIPKKTGNTTAYWVGENPAAAVTESGMTFGHIEMRPHKCAGLSKASTWMGDYSDPGIWGLLQADLLETIALAIDLAGFSGTGATAQPLGIIGQISNTVNFTAAPSAALVAGVVPYELYEKLIEMEEVLRTTNAINRPGNFGYAMHPLVYKTIRKIRSSPRSTTVYVGDVAHQIIEAPNPLRTINGYPFQTSTQLTGTDGSADIIFGNWSDLYRGNWGSAVLGPTNILSDDAAKFMQAIVIAVDVDFALRQTDSFVKGSNVPAVT